MPKNAETLRPIESAVVARPPPYHRIDQLREVLQALVVLRADTRVDGTSHVRIRPPRISCSSCGGTSMRAAGPQSSTLTTALAARRIAGRRSTSSSATPDDVRYRP